LGCGAASLDFGFYKIIIRFMARSVRESLVSVTIKCDKERTPSIRIE
jgi:hypothetical protein